MAIFELTARGPLHQGEFVGINREAALDWIPSDSLFAAIVAAWARRGLNVSERLAGFQPGQKPPFGITSAFPRAGAVRFYPAPPRLPKHSGLVGEGQSGKAAKKIRWLSQGVLEALIAGQTPDASDDNFLHGKTTWLTDSERQSISSLFEKDESGKASLWRKQIVPHVAVDRASNASNLFHTGRVTFGRDCGLWFAARGHADGVREALGYLADAGLGGLRSTGHGAFTLEERADDLPEANEWGLTLSRYAPQTDDEIRGLQNPDSAYKLVTVGGWCEDDDGHPWRRRAVRLIAEGALLPATARGALVDVRPKKIEEWRDPLRPVYRSGLAFMIPAGKLVEAT
jgi:CRISPR-associated protein Csm4